MGANAWKRMMDYCDGKEPYSGDAYSDVSLEHLRTDIIAHNDARLDEITTLRTQLAEAQAKVSVLKDSEECSHQIIMSRGVELEEMDTRIATLERDLAEAQGRVCELAFLNQKLLASIATLERENAELAADKARLDWFFGPDEKYPFLATYMEGVRAGWNVDQWRAAIDAAMHPAEPDAGDGGEGAR